MKKILEETGKKYAPNILAAIVSVILSVAVSAGYLVYTATTVTPQIIVTVIAIVFLSWLSSMLGFDKVKQAIMQIREK